MEKEKYIPLEMELISFSTEDVIVTSYEDDETPIVCTTVNA